MDKYYYKDFETGKLHHTRAAFAGWTESAGPLNIRYAVFARKADIMYIPEYCLTKETRQVLEAKSQEHATSNGGAQ